MFFGRTQPKFGVVPAVNNGNNIQMSEVSNTTAVYNITNNTAVTRTLTMSPIIGISQNTQSVGACANPFTLPAKGGSCLLSLVINGSQLQSNVFEGPVICKTQGNNNNTPSPFLCSEPSQANTLNIHVGTPFAYISNASTDTGTRCEVSLSTGTLGNCIRGKQTLTGLEDIALTSNGQQAYLVSASTGVSTCTIDALTGAFYNCYDTDANLYSGYQTITFNATETLAYITSFSNNTIVKCNVNSTTHNLSGCSSTGTQITQPQSLSLNAANTRAYITNYSGSINVTQCNVETSTGNLIGCGNSGATLISSSGTDDIEFNSTETFAYISADTGGKITQCNVNASTGNLSNCVDSGATNLGIPFGMALNSDNTFIYVADFSNSNIKICSITPGTGHLTACENAGATDLTNPTNIVLR